MKQKEINKLISGLFSGGIEAMSFNTKDLAETLQNRT
jgi:hypothetical protein